MCLDSTRARRALHATIHGRSDIYLMDLGNRASDGQVVFGHTPLQEQERREKAQLPQASIHPEGSTLLPYPYDVLPKLIDQNQIDDDTPSCGLAEALEREDLFVNQSVVTPALAIL